MDTWKYFAITHADHVVCNPTSTERFDELIGLLDLEPGASVWEAACGKGELLVRLAERHRSRGTGVDMSPYEIAVARERAAARAPAAKLTIIEGDAAAHRARAGECRPRRLPRCQLDLGRPSRNAPGAAGLHQARRAVLVGEPYWRGEPDPAYLAAAELAAGDFSTLHGNVAIAAEEGLTLLYALPSRDEDWDRYEMLQLRAAERWALAHPDDPDVDELLARARRGADAYLRWGRDTLGWAIYLFRAPG